MRQSQREQDEAADGLERRKLRLADGTVVLASVAVRRYQRTPNQCYGYLQFKAAGKTVTKFAAQAPGFSHGVSGIRLLSVIEDV
jgi:hypothetical protein